MKKILVTGANGQLGQELRELSKQQTDSFVFVDIDQLDITEQQGVQQLFQEEGFDYCVNCAAYTAVDKAESDQALAEKVNVLGVKVLAETCQQFGAKLIHISTDFVFDGKSFLPYKEEDKTKPISVYGLTKLQGEQQALKANPKTVVLRTSWLYSSFGNNFVKTMLRLGSEREELGIIVDQIGTPTYAGDLAKVVVEIIRQDKELFGVYHFSNEGVASWYDFALAILEGAEVKVNPIPTVAYPTPAARPHYSVLDKTKIKEAFDIEIPYWRTSLKTCLELLSVHNIQ
ncbi:dTDP-4-dehydrorhamnose reductase [Algivirga pacifica]|uniref:dTDP-4-dehydrorhamnose reductase n=1 Tax=Algivirga pacifica TaxID=1162670 RepID=A0ABP9DC61_9BACT